MYLNKHLLSISCIIWVTFLLQNIGYSQAASSRTLNYEILAGDKLVGQLAVSEKKKNYLKTTDTVFQLDLKQVGIDYAVAGRSNSSFENEQLISFDHWLVEQKEQWHLDGKRMEKGLWVSAAKVKSREQRDVDELITFTGAIASTAIPYGGLAMDVIKIFTDTEEEGEEEIPLCYYQTTDLELGPYLLSLPKWEGTKKIKVFFTDSLEREKLKVRSLGMEKRKVGGKEYSCRKFLLKTGSERTILYLAANEDFGPTIIEQQDSDSDVSLTTILVSIEDE